MASILIVPARAGSKRIPGKNTRSFLGTPILTITLERAFQSNCFDQVYVSSEDEGTLELAEKSGATAISRPTHLSSDTATTIEVVQNGILHLGLSNDSHVSVTYPTSILSPETFAHLVRESLAKPEIFLIGVAKFPHPIQRALLPNQTGQQGQTLDLFLPQTEFSSARTQDLTTTYFDAGKYYGASASCWMNASEIIGSKVRGYPLSRTESIDIDQEEDWQFAETVARGRS